MKIILDRYGGVVLKRRELITRGQANSRFILAEWGDGESPQENGQILPDNMSVQICITRPDGEQSGWLHMLNFGGNSGFRYILQSWDTIVSGEAEATIRWFDVNNPDTIYTSERVNFIIDNGVIAQPVPPNLSNEVYDNLNIAVTSLSSRAFSVYNALSLPEGVEYSVDGLKTSPALYYNFSHDVYICEDENNTLKGETLSGVLLVVKLNTNTCIEWFFADSKIFNRKIHGSEAEEFFDSFTSIDVFSNVLARLKTTIENNIDSVRTEATTYTDNKFEGVINNHSNILYSIALLESRCSSLSSKITLETSERKAGDLKKLDKTSFNRANILSLLGEATAELSGVMSAIDKARLDILYHSLADGSNNGIVDTLKEVLDIFNQYREGTTLVNALAGKVDKSTKINGQQLVGDVFLTKNCLGLGRVDNTSDEDKPLSKEARRVLAEKINIENIVDNLTTFDKNKVLSSQQGALLNKKVEDRTKTYLTVDANGYVYINDK